MWTLASSAPQILHFMIDKYRRGCRSANAPYRPPAPQVQNANMTDSRGPLPAVVRAFHFSSFPSRPKSPNERIKAPAKAMANQAIQGGPSLETFSASRRENPERRLDRKVPQPDFQVSVPGQRPFQRFPLNSPRRRGPPDQDPH